MSKKPRSGRFNALVVFSCVGGSKATKAGQCMINAGAIPKGTETRVIQQDNKVLAKSSAPVSGKTSGFFAMSHVDTEKLLKEALNYPVLVIGMKMFLRCPHTGYSAAMNTLAAMDVKDAFVAAINAPGEPPAVSDTELKNALKETTTTCEEQTGGLDWGAVSEIVDELDFTDVLLMESILRQRKIKAAEESEALWEAAAKSISEKTKGHRPFKLDIECEFLKFGKVSVAMGVDNHHTPSEFIINYTVPCASAKAVIRTVTRGTINHPEVTTTNDGSDTPLLSIQLTREWLEFLRDRQPIEIAEKVFDEFIRHPAMVNYF